MLLLLLWIILGKCKIAVILIFTKTIQSIISGVAIETISEWILVVLPLLGLVELWCFESPLLLIVMVVEILIPLVLILILIVVDISVRTLSRFIVIFWLRLAFSRFRYEFCWFSLKRWWSKLFFFFWFLSSNFRALKLGDHTDSLRRFKYVSFVLSVITNALSVFFKFLDCLREPNFITVKSLGFYTFAVSTYQ